jgi:antitoxin (DNA-binding transcriptional repressor) of toxin-antitoxin stability system
MKASFVDLRKKSSEIIRALHRNEEITVLYRGKPAAIMHPVNGHSRKSSGSVKDHKAFGLLSKRTDMKDVDQYVRNLRKGRFDVI